MLPDQANDLRNLVLRAVRSVGGPDVPPPKNIVIAGGKGGVGTTTIAVNFATALAREGRRVVLVDADFAGPNVAELCGLDGTYGAADVLAGRRTVHEVLERGPTGIQVLPASRGIDAEDCTPLAQDRLLTQLRGLGAYVDYVLIDAGSGGTRTMRRFWEAADGVLVVVHPDPVAVMDAYALIKMICNDDPPTTPVAAVVNCADDESTDVLARLDRACRRFLGFSVAAAGGIPLDANVPRSAAQRRPLLLEAPHCAAAAAFDRLAAEVPALVAAGDGRHHHFRRTSSQAG